MALGLWFMGMTALWRSSDFDLVSPVCICSTTVQYICHLLEVGKREALALTMMAQLAIAIAYAGARRTSSVVEKTG